MIMIFLQLKSIGIGSFFNEKHLKWINKDNYLHRERTE